MNRSNETKLIFPGLAGFYASMLPVAATLVRVVVGIMFLVHVWGKFNAGHARIAAAFGNNYGLPMPGLFAYAAMGMELIGGVCLIIGLFTRFWAAAAAIEMALITMLYWKTGFSWLSRGYEYTLLWGFVCFAIALRGGGPYSLDRKIGTEL